MAKNTKTKARRAPRATANDTARVLSMARRLLLAAANAPLTGAPRRQYATASAPPAAVVKPRKAGKTTTETTRGRTPGNYYPAVKKVDNATGALATVFAHILKNKKNGITQKQIQDELNLPHSTVWYALTKLRAMNAIRYEAAPSARAAA